MNNKGGILNILFIFIIFIVLVIVALAFLSPGLIWGRDLGINYRKTDYDSAIDKISNSLGNDNYVKLYLTSVELTALANERCKGDCPYKDAQIKVNDKDIEIVAKVSRDYILEKSTNEQIEAINNKYPFIGILPSDINVYIKISGYVLDNVASLESIVVTIQGIPIPSDYFIGDKLEGIINKMNETLLSEQAKNSLNVKLFEFSKDNLMIEGTLPNNFKVE